MTLLSQGKKKRRKTKNLKTGHWLRLVFLVPGNHSLSSGVEEIVTSAQSEYKTEKEFLINVKAALIQESLSRISALFPSNYCNSQDNYLYWLMKQNLSTDKEINTREFFNLEKKARVQVAIMSSWFSHYLSFQGDFPRFHWDWLCTPFLETR